MSRRLLIDVYRQTDGFSGIDYNVANELRSQCIRLVTGIAVAFEVNPEFPDRNLLAVTVATASILSEKFQRAGRSGVMSQIELGKLTAILSGIRDNLVNLTIHSDLN